MAFVAALQHLPPRQRAALLLTEVVGFSAAEAAECMETSVAAVNSAIQRVRATLGRLDAEGSSEEPLSAAQSRLLDRDVDAFHRYDVDGLVALMREDATLSMPPDTSVVPRSDAVCLAPRPRNRSAGRGSYRPPHVAPRRSGGTAWAAPTVLVSPGRSSSWILRANGLPRGIRSSISESLFPLSGYRHCCQPTRQKTTLSPHDELLEVNFRISDDELRRRNGPARPIRRPRPDECGARRCHGTPLKEIGVSSAGTLHCDPPQVYRMIEFGRLVIRPLESAVSFREAP